MRSHFRRNLTAVSSQLPRRSTILYRSVPGWERLTLRPRVQGRDERLFQQGGKPIAYCYRSQTAHREKPLPRRGEVQIRLAS